MQDETFSDVAWSQPIVPLKPIIASISSYLSITVVLRFPKQTLIILNYLESLANLVFWDQFELASVLQEDVSACLIRIYAYP